MGRVQETFIVESRSISLQSEENDESAILSIYVNTKIIKTKNYLLNENGVIHTEISFTGY